MSQPLVSIIMPVYNGARFIAESIESVLAQTWQSWELVVVNDGSIDETEDILTRYEIEQRIRCFHQENSGLAVARNVGICNSSGKYLAFLDADDRWDPRFMTYCLDILETKADIVGVYTGNYYIDGMNALLPMISQRVVKPKLLYEQLLRAGFFPPCAVIVKSDVVREVGMFDTSLAAQGTEDWDLWLRITKHYRMQGVSEPLVFYRVYPGSMSTNILGMYTCRMSVLNKYFGSAEGFPTTWPQEKRLSYGYAVRAAALDFISQGQPEIGWEWLEKAVYLYPQILTDLTTYYEIACRDQSRGYRGDVRFLDISKNGSDMVVQLESLFTNGSSELMGYRAPALGNAYLVLSMLCDLADDWDAARQYIRNAIRTYPKLLLSVSTLRRLFKLHIGKRLIRFFYPGYR